MTFKDLKKRLSIETQQQTRFFDRLDSKPFWIWNTEEHRKHDIRTSGDCCHRRVAIEEFCDVSIGEGNERTTFDIVIDSSHVINDSDVVKSKSSQLKKVLEDYGAVIMKIVDGYVERNHVESFVHSLTRYVSISKNQVGLGIKIGEGISPEAKESAYKLISRRRQVLSNKPFLLIDKPSFPCHNS